MFNETSSKIKELLKGMLTAENSEQITAIVNEVSNLENEHKKTEEDLVSIKDKLVDYVTKTAFTPNAQLEIEQEQPKVYNNPDEAFDDAFKEILNKEK